MTDKKLSRRDFLKMSTTAAAGAVVASKFSVPETAQTSAKPVLQNAVEIVFVTTESVNDSSAQLAPVLKAYQQTHPNFSVKWLGVSSQNGWGDYFDKLAVVIAGGETVNIAKIPTEGGRLAVARGLIIPLDKYIKATDMTAYFKDISPKLADVFKFKGVTYALPYDYNNMMIWFNTKLLKEAGLDMPKEDSNLADFRKYATALTKVSGDTVTQYGYANAAGTSPFGLCPWLFNNGLDGMLGGAAQDKALQTDPAYVEVIQMLYDMMNKEKSLPQPDSPIAADPIGSLEAGKLGMMGAGRWPIGQYIKDKFTDFAVQYWPKGTRRVTEVGCGSWPIFTASKVPDAVWDFETWLLRPDSIASFETNGGNIPASRSLSTTPDFISKPPVGGNLWYGSIDRDDIPVLSVTAPPDYSDMFSINDRDLANIFTNKVSVADGLATMQKDLQDMISQRPPEWATQF